MENKLYCCKWKSYRVYTAIIIPTIIPYFYKYQMPQSLTLAGQMATNMDYSSAKQHEENVQKQKYLPWKAWLPTMKRD